MDLRTLIRRWLPGRSLPSGEAAGHLPAAAQADAASWNDRGLEYLGTGDLADAARCFGRALELRHDFARAHGNLGAVYERHGQTEDALDCYQLAAHFDPALPEACLGLARTLQALGRPQEAVAAMRDAVAANPDFVPARLKLANLLQACREWHDALGHYERIVAADPQRADVRCNLALVLYELARYAEAREQCLAALRCDPHLAEAHHNLALVLLAAGEPAAALTSAERALELRPRQAASLALAGHALRDLGRLDEAIARYDAALAIVPEFGDALINRCYVRLAQGHFEKGWKEYERRFEATGTAGRGFPYPLWRGEPLAGKTVLIYAEQGLGDEIMFASCIPDVLRAAGRVVIECNTRLAALFRRAFPTAYVHGGGKNDAQSWLKDAPRTDYQIAIGSLPRHFRTMRAAFPPHDGYLKADAVRVAAWRERLAGHGPGPRIGISWRGGTPKTRQQLRSVPLADLLHVFSATAARLISLQYGDCRSEIESACAGTVIPVAHWPDALSDLDETAALMCALDLVVTVDNTVAHLAGALGRPAWVLLSFSPEWRYLAHGLDMPWYPSLRLFRQARPGDWRAPLASIRAKMQQARGAAA